MAQQNRGTQAQIVLISAHVSVDRCRGLRDCEVRSWRVSTFEHIAISLAAQAPDPSHDFIRPQRCASTVAAASCHAVRVRLGQYRTASVAETPVDRTWHQDGLSLFVPIVFINWQVAKINFLLNRFNGTRSRRADQTYRVIDVDPALNKELSR